MNREEWLTTLAASVEAIFKGFRVKPYRITCGWPCSGGLGSRVGECHAAESSKSNHFEIFISPRLDKPLEVAGTVCHELAHVVAGIKAGHGKEFVKVCTHAGITKGPPKSMEPGLDLTKRLESVITRMPPYPHAAIVGTAKPKKPPHVVGLGCPRCSCKVTISLKNLDAAGYPTCGCGTKFKVKDADSEDG